MFAIPYTSDRLGPVIEEVEKRMGIEMESRPVPPRPVARIASTADAINVEALPQPGLLVSLFGEHKPDSYSEDGGWLWERRHPHEFGMIRYAD